MLSRIWLWFMYYFFERQREWKSKRKNFSVSLLSKCPHSWAVCQTKHRNPKLGSFVEGCLPGSVLLRDFSTNNWLLVECLLMISALHLPYFKSGSDLNQEVSQHYYGNEFQAHYNKGWCSWEHPSLRLSTYSEPERVALLWRCLLSTYYLWITALWTSSHWWMGTDFQMFDLLIIIYFSSVITYTIFRLVVWCVWPLQP